MNFKKQKIKDKKKEEELPSFLQNLQNKREETDFSKQNFNDGYLGPLFLTACQDYHPPPHSLKFGTITSIQRSQFSKEDLLEPILLPKTKTPSVHYESKVVRLVKKKEVSIPDLYPHRCPGVRRVYKTGISSFVIDFGETSSIITGEASREIPVCRLKKICSSFSGFSHKQYEFVELSDIREKRRMFMSDQERAAHAHFLKDFVTLRVIGPTIPSSIIITQLPSKRRREFDFPESEETEKSKGAKAEVKKTEKVKPSSGKTPEGGFAAKSKEDVAMEGADEEVRDVIEEMADEVKDTIQGITDGVKASVEEASDEVKYSIEESSDEVKYSIEEISEEGKDSIEEISDEEKEDIEGEKKIRENTSEGKEAEGKVQAEEADEQGITNKSSVENENTFEPEPSEVEEEEDAKSDKEDE